MHALDTLVIGAREPFFSTQLQNTFIVPIPDPSRPSRLVLGRTGSWMSTQQVTME